MKIVSLRNAHNGNVSYDWSVDRIEQDKFLDTVMEENLKPFEWQVRYWEDTDMLRRYLKPWIARWRRER